MNISKLDPTYFFKDGTKRPNPYMGSDGRVLEGRTIDFFQWAEQQYISYRNALSPEELEEEDRNLKRFQKKMQSPYN